MSDSFKSIPDPLLPEHRLLRNAGELPVLSSGLRNRVVIDVHKQVRYGRWMDRVRIVASIAAALLFMFGIWSLRQTRPEELLKSDTQPKAERSAPALDHSIAPSGGMHAASPEIPIELRDPAKSGGGSSPQRQNLNEMQQINRLIEHYQQRQNAVCGVLPWL